MKRKSDIGGALKYEGIKGNRETGREREDRAAVTGERTML